MAPPMPPIKSLIKLLTMAQGFDWYGNKKGYRNGSLNGAAEVVAASVVISAGGCG